MTLTECQDFDFISIFGKQKRGEILSYLCSIYEFRVNPFPDFLSSVEKTHFVLSRDISNNGCFESRN